MFPLMGLLFMIGFAAIVCGICLSLFKRTRFLAPFVCFPLLGSASFAFCLFWAGGLISEQILGKSRLTSLAAFLGLGGGFILGGLCGLFIAWRVSRRSTV
jgi:hypothetical protein